MAEIADLRWTGKHFDEVEPEMTSTGPPSHSHRRGASQMYSLDVLIDQFLYCIARIRNDITACKVERIQSP